MRIVDDHEVTESEKITRFIFGAIAGVFLSIFIIYEFDFSSPGAIVLTVLVSILTFGILALIHGDRFWYALFGVDRN